ncbi:hypothetical protein M569_10400, partial [Genlisea aurea]
KFLIIAALFLYLILIPILTVRHPQPLPDQKWPLQLHPPPPQDRTNLSHIAFGVMGSVQMWPHRRGYQEAWWRPNATRGFIYLDRPPPPEFLPWPETAPPYRVVDNISRLFEKEKPRFELMPRMVHGILQLFREVDGDDLRWIVMGDDDTVFFADNVADVLSEYDHERYYYLGWHSESVISNLWFSFDMAFGGGGIVLSRPLAAALARDMDDCLVRYAASTSADLITMTCIADIGVNLTPHKGIHQGDLHGDLSGYLWAHPKVPVMAFHHFGAVEPIFPGKDRFESTRHLMTASDADQSRLFQQTICHLRRPNREWSVSVSWGYSAQIYERVFPRSYLQVPIETFTPWARGSEPPFFMFNTRPVSNDPCEAPHVFFLDSVEKTAAGDRILTTYVRARPRGLPPCAAGENRSADPVAKITVSSPATKRIQIDRCECCDVVEVDDVEMEVNYRECRIDEIIA